MFVLSRNFFPKLFPNARNVFGRMLGLRNSVIFQKEQRQVFQNQTKLMQSIYYQEKLVFWAYALS